MSPDRVQARMQWPSASMTREDFRMHSQGSLLHRDFSLLPDVNHPISRQDAPAGQGPVMLYNPRSLGPNSMSSVPRLPQLPSGSAHGQRWQPFRGAIDLPREPTPMPLVHRSPMESWQPEVRQNFPRCTMTIPRDRPGNLGKADLMAKRSNERWASRLAQRGCPSPGPSLPVAA